MTVRITETRYGRQLYLDTDIYFAPLLELCGEYSEGEVALFRQFIRPGDVVVDAGAHIGCHTLALAQLVGPVGNVIAFEPQALMFRCLCGSLVLNNNWNVLLYHLALGVIAQHAKILTCDYSQMGNYGGVEIISNEKSGADTMMVPLDSFDIPKLAFMKIDVEGSECEVLQGSKETIARCRPILYVENDRPQNSERLIGLMQDMGYALYSHTPPLWNPNNWKGRKEAIFPGIVSIMILGVPKEMQFETNLPPIR